MNDERGYRYWKDKDNETGKELNIRTCEECKYSEVKCEDGMWCAYVTFERIEFLHKNNYSMKCSLCEERLYGRK